MFKLERLTEWLGREWRECKKPIAVVLILFAPRFNLSRKPRSQVINKRIILVENPDDPFLLFQGREANHYLGNRVTHQFRITHTFIDVFGSFDLQIIFEVFQ